MKLTELTTILRRSKIPKHAYSLNGGLPNDAYCFEAGDNGKWYTYYSERGQRADLREFDSEESACDYFYEMLRNEPDF